MALLKMAHQKEANSMFHDFLGIKADSPAASAAGARGSLSAASDVASERQPGNHLEGIPFYGPRSEISGPEMSNRLAGSKRSNLDSAAFTGSTRDGIPQIGHDTLESHHLMKMLKSGGGAERSRRSNEDEFFHNMKSMRPTRFDANATKWDRPTPVGPTIQYPPRGGQFVPFGHQAHMNKFRDLNAAGPSVISQSAADEGSRTGIKGPGILSSINAATEKNASASMPSGSKPRPGINISEPELSTPSNRQSLTSGSRQMTIFYGGQAHVFDDVHPNKAEVIMALAGSNGGSWSTTFSSKATGRPGGENYVTSGENEARIAANVAALQHEIRGRLLGSTSGANQGLGSGVHHGSVEERRKQIQAGETSGGEKREVVLK